MPSKGFPIIKVRVSPLVLAAIEERIKSRNDATSEEPWKVSHYLRYVIMTDLAHRQAGKRAGERRKKIKA